MTPIDTLRKLLEAADEGPWVIDGTSIYGKGRDSTEPHVFSIYAGNMPNAEAVVALRNAAPALLQVVEAAKAFVVNSGGRCDMHDDDLFDDLEDKLKALEAP
jgi:hypothetical protein